MEFNWLVQGGCLLRAFLRVDFQLIFYEQRICFTEELVEMRRNFTKHVTVNSASRSVCRPVPSFLARRISQTGILRGK